jgi:hypothetical protein
MPFSRSPAAFRGGWLQRLQVCGLVAVLDLGRAVPSLLPLRWLLLVAPVESSELVRGAHRGDRRRAAPWKAPLEALRVRRQRQSTEALPILHTHTHNQNHGLDARCTLLTASGRCRVLQPCCTA